MDQRTRNHIKAIAEVLAEDLDAKHPGVLWISGMVNGLAAAVRIADGDSAEEVLERIAHDLAAAIGNAYLNGDLPPRTEAS